MKCLAAVVTLAALALCTAPCLTLASTQPQYPGAAKGIVLAPPPEPAVTPEIVCPTDLDADSNRVDDNIQARIKKIRLEATAEPDPSKRRVIEAQLEEPVRVELIFSRQITQQQIDDFLALGGEIEYIYRAVSYGWNGTLPLRAVEVLPQTMGKSFVAVIGDYPIRAALDEATQYGRVRPIWANGFAGTSGFAGDNNTTIAIIDSGIDDAHPDFDTLHRKKYWKDWTAGNVANPEDYCGHGTHVASIAFGIGGSGGSGGTLYYTDQGNASDLDSGYFYSRPIHITNVANTTFTSVAKWNGGGTTSLYQASRANGTTGGWTWLSAATTGASPLTEANTFNSGTSQYSAALTQNSSRSVGAYAIKNSVTNYPDSPDGRYRFNGVAYYSAWAALKVLGTDGTGWSTDFCEAVDDVVSQRVAYKIKVANMSIGLLGSPGVDTTLRAKVNTAVNNGVVMVISAGNDGPGTAGANQIDDPGRAALAITVAACNDVNQLTKYTSSGFSPPGSDEDYKPDIMAPGGSWYYSGILAADTNDGDQQNAFTDQQANDYCVMVGTSMASPFVAGSAALVIQALEYAGLTWDHYSKTTALKVKMLLCATATESNQNREVSSGTDPTLGRAANPKDLYEGYGMVNPDAAVEAPLLSYVSGVLSDSTTGGAAERRAWARKVNLGRNSQVTLNLAVPTFADFDLYLYSGTPDDKGNPIILASSCNAGFGVAEAINYRPTETQTAYLVVKRVSGGGTWTLTGTTDSDAPIAGTAASPQYGNSSPIVVNYSGASDVGPSGLKKVELWYKKNVGGTWTNSGLSSSGASGSFNFAGMSGDAVYYFDLVAEDNAGNRSAAPSGDGDCSTTYDTWWPSAPGVPSAGAAYQTDTAITFTWTPATDDLSGVDSYYCAIGTRPDGSDVFEGSVGTDLYKTIIGQVGSAYFCKVMAFDKAGNSGSWSRDYSGITVVQNTGLSIGQAKLLPLGEALPSVGLDGKVFSCAFYEEGEVLACFYVQESDRSAGIRVEPLSSIEWIPPGTIVSLGGTMDITDDGEKCIFNATVALREGPVPRPVYMPHKHLGGADWFWNPETAAGQKGVTGGVGLNNIGLLVRVTGYVLGVSAPGFYWITDGSIPGPLNYDTVVLVVDESGASPEPGRYVTLTGISSCWLYQGEEGTYVVRVLRAPWPQGPQ